MFAGWSVGSFPGDERDGGRRLHRGYDIFPGDTPDLVADRPVRVVNPRYGGRLSGLTADLIFETDDGPRRMVLRHLRELPEAGLYQPGERVAVAGNTGNAATTPTHVHAELYDRRGNLLDPREFFRSPVQDAAGEAVGIPLPEGFVIEDQPAAGAATAQSVAQRGFVSPGDIEDAQATRLTLPEGSEVPEGMALSFPEEGRRRIANYMAFAPNAEALERYAAQTMRDLYGYSDFRFRAGEAERNLAAYRRESTVPTFLPLTYGPDGQPLQGQLQTLAEARAARKELLSRQVISDPLTDENGNFQQQRFTENIGNLFREFSEAIGHPDANRIGREITRTAELTPITGGIQLVEDAGAPAGRGEYGTAIAMAGLGAADFIPGAGPFRRALTGAGEAIGETTVRETIRYSRRAEQEGRRHLQQLERRYTEGQFDLPADERARLFDDITATRARLDGIGRAWAERAPVTIEYELPSLAARAAGRDPATGARASGAASPPAGSATDEAAPAASEPEIAVTAPGREGAARPNADEASPWDFEALPSPSRSGAAGERAPGGAGEAAPAASDPEITVAAPSRGGAGDALIFPPRNTRGGGVFYHGARGEVPQLQEGYYNPDNIYGGFDTFYSTDAADVAAGYGRARESSRVYRVVEREPVNFFDMEERLPAQEVARLLGSDFDNDFGLVPMSIEEALDASGTASLREVMDNIRGFSSEEGVSKDEVQEIFGTAIYNLRERGFGGMTHVGGQRTGRDPHTVRIYFDAPNQLEMQNVTPAPFARPARPAAKERASSSAPSLSRDHPAPARAVDRIDAGEPGGPGSPAGLTGAIDDPALGRVPRLGNQASAAEVSAAVRGIRPEDVAPIPDNQVRSAGEAAAIPSSRPLVDKPPDPRSVLTARSLPSARPGGKPVPFRGPLDLVSFARSRGGLSRAQGGGETGDLARLSNAPRRLPLTEQERRLGSLLRDRGGMTLDDLGEAATEAGFYRVRPTTAQLLEDLEDTYTGRRRLFRDDDLSEVHDFEEAEANLYRWQSAHQEGAPLADDVGGPIDASDLDALDPPATAYEELPGLADRVGNINLGNISTRGDVRRLLRNVEERFGSFEAARRGTIGHGEAEALAREMGMTVDDLLSRRPGQALNAEQIMAARLIFAKSLDEVTTAAERLAARAGGASDEERAAFARMLLTHAAIHEQVSGITAEAGRALSQFRRAASSRALSGRIHESIVQGMGGGARLEDVAQGIIDLQRRGLPPGTVNRFAVDAVKPGFRDKLVELWYNSILSGPQTHAVNILSNAMTQTLQLPEQLTASLIGQLRRGWRALRGRPDDLDRVLLSEVGPRAIGMMQGSLEGLRSAGRTLVTGEVPDFVTKVEARSQRAISGVKGSIIRTPSRFLAAEDEFFKATARRMELNGLAVREARKEGLRGTALRDRIAALSANPTHEMVERAMDQARYLTFQRPLGRLGQRASATTQEYRWLKLFAPFIRTPTNILKFAVERSPLAPLMKEVRADLVAGGERQALAMARMALGTGFGMYVYHLASEGAITGGGPADRMARDTMIADGWQPYSIRIGDTYYSYARLDPLATTLGVAADLVDFGAHMTEGQQQQHAALLITSIARNLANKTWLSGVSDLLGMIDDPQRNLTNAAGRLAGSIVVPTGVNQLTQVLDPQQRETRGDGMFDSVRRRIMSRIPGLSDNLPVRRDVFGNEVTRQGGVGPDIASPIRTSTARNDPVIGELLRIGANVGRPARTLQGRRLQPEEYDAYQRLSGRYIYDDLIEAVQDPEWPASTVEDRRDWVADIKRDARADARADLGLDSGEVEDQGVPPGVPLPEGFVIEP